MDLGEVNRQVTHKQPLPPPGPKPVDDGLSGIEVTDEYEAVVEAIDSGVPVILVVGKAGTGKSTLIQYIRQRLSRNLVVVAPTGVAALNARGSTIHSFFRFPPRPIDLESVEVVRNRILYEKLDLLVVDEVSMVRADLLDAMERFLRLNAKDSSRPFGGVQVLLVGDPFQLAPVVEHREEAELFGRRYRSPYFFSAACLDGCVTVPIELTKVFRQQDARFVRLLDMVRTGVRTEEALAEINAKCAGGRDAPSPMLTLTCTNAAAGRVNHARLKDLPSTEYMFEGQIHGRFHIAKERLPAPFHLRLRENAQVMFTRNDTHGRWVNGTIGTAKELSDDSIEVQLRTKSPGAVYDVQPVTWDSLKYRYDYDRERIVTDVVGQYTQFPLMLAWAVTIHKSQGLTLESALVDLGTGAFAHGQVYVALSRCRSLDDITLRRPIVPHDMLCDKRINEFCKGLGFCDGQVDEADDSMQSAQEQP